MSMARNRGIVSLLCAATLLVACDKGKGGSTGTGGGNPLTGGGTPTASASPLDYFPKDTGMVFGFNWSKFKGTKFFDMLVAAVPPDGKKELDEVKAACGLDYLNDFDSVLVGMGADMDKSKVVIIVKGNWNEDKVAKCATAVGEKKGKKITIAKDGNITSYTGEGEPHAVLVGWVDNMAILTAQSAEGDKAYLAEVMKKASSVKDNKDFMDLFGKVDQGGTCYGALLANADMAGSLGKATGGSEKLAGGYFTLKLGGGLDFNGAGRFGSPDEAKAVAERMNKELDGAKQSPQAGAFLKNASISASDKDMVVKVSLDDQQLDQLIQMIKQMVPMLGMMMGGGGQ
jgi:hypothetical protein